MEFKDRLKELRNEFNLTQTDLAKTLNYGYTAISNYESGRNEPSMTDLKKLAKFFNVSLDYFLCITDMRKPFVQVDTEPVLDYLVSNIQSLDKNSIHELNLFIDWLLYRQSVTDLQKDDCYKVQSYKPVQLLRVAEAETEYEL